ncbi:MAG TPA: hypothetical protein VNG51_22095 [Ktedonobacteraceae bacterium]|nr:hypothetical protein [Ktedonobacteraceae bacterium]
MVREDTAQSRPQTETISYDSRPISWWSWRPGIRPHNALLIGMAFSLVALLFISLGAVVLAFSIRDSVSPTITVPGIVTHHTIAGLDNAYYLTLRLQTPGFPTSVSAAVSAGAYHTIHDGDHILAEYSPMLHVLNALDSVGQQGQHSQHYVLPNSGAGGILLGAIALLLLGVLLLPYPAVLARWGWRDLYVNRHSQQGTLQISGTVVALRAADQTQMRRPGMLPRRGVRTWYGVAVLPDNTTKNTGDIKNSGIARVVTLAVNQETFRTVEEGATVTITCSPHLHYVYSLKHTGETSA